MHRICTTSNREWGVAWICNLFAMGSCLSIPLLENDLALGRHGAISVWDPCRTLTSWKTVVGTSCSKFTKRFRCCMEYLLWVYWKNETSAWTQDKNLGCCRSLVVLIHHSSARTSSHICVLLFRIRTGISFGIAGDWVDVELISNLSSLSIHLLGNEIPSDRQ